MVVPTLSYGNRMSNDMQWMNGKKAGHAQINININEACLLMQNGEERALGKLVKPINKKKKSVNHIYYCCYDHNL